MVWWRLLCSGAALAESTKNWDIKYFIHNLNENPILSSLYMQRCNVPVLERCSWICFQEGCFCQGRRGGCEGRGLLHKLQGRRYMSPAAGKCQWKDFALPQGSLCFCRAVEKLSEGTFLHEIAMVKYKKREVRLQEYSQTPFPNNPSRSHPYGEEMVLNFWDNFRIQV